MTIFESTHQPFVGNNIVICIIRVTLVSYAEVDENVHLSKSYRWVKARLTQWRFVCFPVTHRYIAYRYWNGAHVPQQKHNMNNAQWRNAYFRIFHMPRENISNPGHLGRYSVQKIYLNLKFPPPPSPRYPKFITLFMTYLVIEDRIWVPVSTCNISYDSMPGLSNQMLSCETTMHSKISIGMLTMKYRWSTSRLQCQLVEHCTISAFCMLYFSNRLYK